MNIYNFVVIFDFIVCELEFSAFINIKTKKKKILRQEEEISKAVIPMYIYQSNYKK